MSKIILLLGLLSLFAGPCWSFQVEVSMVGDAGSLSSKLDSKFRTKDAPFAETRHPVEGAAARKKMLSYITNQLELLNVLARQKGFQSTTQHLEFTTDIMYKNDHKAVNGTNVIFVLHGTVNASDDEPIMLMANYDTPISANNVNEGSGVAALLVILENIVQNLNTVDSKYVLRRSVVFAFTDVAHKKYGESVRSARGETGAHVLADKWLAHFLMDRKNFRGALVLDNLLNYNVSTRSQLVTGTNIDKSFPDAYKELAEANFVGDFVGLVYRDDHYDNPLAQSFSRGWDRAASVRRNTTGPSPYYDAKLLPFKFTKNIFSSTATNHFLDSEQSALWNESPTIGQRQYPAVLLTDTRNFRSGCRTMCPAEVPSDSLKFLARTVVGIQFVIFQAQADRSGAFNAQASVVLLILSMLFAFLQRH